MASPVPRDPLSSLREADERFRQSFENAPIGMALVAPDGRFIRVNRSLCEMTGHGEEQLLAGNFQEITHPDDLDADLSLLERLLAGEIKTYELEKRYIRPDGSVVWCLLTVSLVREPDGSPRYFISQIQNIDARKRAEAQLLIESAFTANMAEGACLIRASDNVIVHANAAAERMFGYDAGGLTGLHISALNARVHGTDPSEIVDRNTAALERADGPYSTEILSVRRDGSTFWRRATVSSCEHPEHGRLWVAVHADVTEERALKQELERERDHGVALLDALARDRRLLMEAEAIAGLGSWDYDLENGPPGSWSLELWKIFGLEPQDAVPSMQEFYALIDPEDRERMTAVIEAALRSPAPFDEEFWIVRPNGERARVAFRARVDRDASGRPVRARGTMQDVTERATSEAEQAALHQIAALVAQGAEPTVVFESVAREVCGVLGATAGAVVRLSQPGEPDVIAGTWSAEGRPGAWRIDGERARGDVSASIVVGGRPWGVVVAAFARGPAPARAEARLASFAELVAVAIANAEALDTLSRDATTDALSGIANRRMYAARLDEEIDRARRYRRELSLVIIDIDRFKEINDQHGHQTGDVVLAEAARRLASEARNGELVARIGGEEFGWIMPETDEGGARVAADRARRAFEAEPFGEIGMLTLSAGVSSLRTADDASALIARADAALYAAKAAGRNRTVVHSVSAHDLRSHDDEQPERAAAGHDPVTG